MKEMEVQMKMKKKKRQIKFRTPQTWTSHKALPVVVLVQAKLSAIP
jgi:hypothetical protein